MAILGSFSQISARAYLPICHISYGQLRQIGYCEQNGDNAVEWCAVMYHQLHEDVNFGWWAGEGYPTNHNLDQAPDPEKFMYKGVIVLDKMDFEQYDAYVAKIEARRGG